MHFLSKLVRCFLMMAMGGLLFVPWDRLAAGPADEKSGPQAGVQAAQTGAGEAGRQQKDAKAEEQQVSLGVRVTKPSKALYAQLPSLPTGCGFLIESLVPGGAAASAGLQPMDLIWRLDEQILINEGQMMVLLSHRRPGQWLNVSYYRSGQAREARVCLQSRGQTPGFPDFIEAGTPPSLLPMRVISYEDRSASISDQTGTATLTFREGKFWLRVESEKGVETYNDFVGGDSQLAQVPKVWRSRLPVLKRSLEESVKLRRLPRVRHIPRHGQPQNVAGEADSGR